MTIVQSLIQSATQAPDPLALLRAARQQRSDVARVLLHCQIRWVGTHASAEVCHQDEPEKDPR
jgi:chloramphenicol 3-O-phosphotransferase